MPSDVPDAALTLVLLVGMIWLVGALFIKLSDTADQHRTALLAKRRALLVRHGHRQGRSD